MYNEAHSYGHIHTLSSSYPRSTIPVSPSGPPMKHPQSLTRHNAKICVRGCQYLSIRCDLSPCVNTCLVFGSFIDDGNIFHLIIISLGPVWIIYLLAKAVR